MTYVDHGHRHGPGGSDPIPNLPTGGGGAATTLAYIVIFEPNMPNIPGDEAAAFWVPPELDGYLLTHVYAFVSHNGNTSTVQIHDSVTGDILTTPLTIDHLEFDSRTAATPAVIDPTKTLMYEGRVLFVDVDVAGLGTRGLTVVLVMDPP